jgi:hypothetical protein
MGVTDTGGMKVRGNLRPVSDAHQLIDNMLSGQKPYNAAVGVQRNYLKENE